MLFNVLVKLLIDREKHYSIGEFVPFLFVFISCIENIKLIQTGIR